MRKWLDEQYDQKDKPLGNIELQQFQRDMECKARRVGKS